MAKVTIEFNLPEEQDEYEIHHKAGKYLSAIGDIADLLRSAIKCGNVSTWWVKPLTEHDIDLIDALRNRVCDILVDNEVD
jgi:hypothetical protein